MMKNKAFLFATLIVTLILNACSPFSITSSSGQQPTPVIESEPAIGYQVVQVDQVQVEVGVGSPIPVQVIVSGTLPDRCAQIELMQLQQDGANFKVTLSAVPSKVEGCVQDALPFRINIPLNIVNLPSGPYEINVNGVTASFDPTAKPASNSDLEDFESQLQTALAQRNPEAMRALMSERFMIAHWQSEGESIPSEDATAQLIANHIAEHNFLQFHDFQNIPAFDPQAFVGPDLELAKAVFVSGWGLDSRGDALLFIARRPGGSLLWQGVLVTPRGFAPPLGQACTEPVAVPSVNEQVSYNGVSFRVDPSLDYGLAARICPGSAGDNQQMGNEAHPPYTQFFFPTYPRQNIDFQPEIRVYEVTGDLEQYLFSLNMLSDLQTVIDRHSEPVTWFDHAPLHARQVHLGFTNGAGVRSLVQYMQDPFFFTNNGLTYEFHGLTADGHYFVSVRYPLSTPFLMELSGPDPLSNSNPNAIAIPDWPNSYEQQVQIIEAYNAEALSRLEQMSDGDALPDIALLDALVQSIEVINP
jgi:hypothetical protein